jgi:mono/diheme cytochrome c family protein
MENPVTWRRAFVTFLLLLVVAAFVYVRQTGLRARATPGRFDARLARTVRSWAISSRDRQRRNPIPVSDAAVRDGLEHYADHCASCHADDGSGETMLGTGLFPPPPDLRDIATQRLTDGELFYVIENGIRFTGMPGFGTATAEGEEQSWKLVLFIRHLPKLTAEERQSMKDLIPRSPAEIRQEIEEERFLRGEGPG